MSCFERRYVCVWRAFFRFDDRIADVIGRKFVDVLAAFITKGIGMLPVQASRLVREISVYVRERTNGFIASHWLAAAKSAMRLPV